MSSASPAVSSSDASSKDRSPSVTLRFMAAPTDVLTAGAFGVDGGRVLEWIDKAAYACATAWSGRYCVTAYVGHIHMNRPIPVGHIVEVRSRIAMTGRSSMHIINEVYSADPREGRFTEATNCLVIFVAKDSDTGKSVPVPEFVPSTEEQIYEHAVSESRIGLRQAIEEEMAKQTYDGPSEAPRLVTRFLASPNDVNWGGKVHGGTAMEWIFESATACTMEWSGQRTVAVYAGGIRFYRPIQIGDLIEVDSRIMRTDTRSMQVSVHVRSGDPRGGRDQLDTAIHAAVTFLGIDIDGHPLPARQFVPRTEEDVRLAEHAVTLRKLRAQWAPKPLTVHPSDPML